MKKLTFAAPTADQQQAGYARMSELTLVTGDVVPDGSASPDLGGTLTRAQLVTIIVRAFGQETNVKVLSGSAASRTFLPASGTPATWP